jgi:hypothetical protein
LDVLKKHAAAAEEEFDAPVRSLINSAIELEEILKKVKRGCRRALSITSKAIDYARGCPYWDVSVDASPLS